MDTDNYSISPGYLPRNSYIDSVAYVQGYPNSTTHPVPKPDSDVVGFAVVDSAILVE